MTLGSGLRSSAGVSLMIALSSDTRFWSGRVFAELWLPFAVIRPQVQRSQEVQERFVEERLVQLDLIAEQEDASQPPVHVRSARARLDRGAEERLVVRIDPRLCTRAHAVPDQDGDDEHGPESLAEPARRGTDEQDAPAEHAQVEVPVGERKRPRRLERDEHRREGGGHEKERAERDVVAAPPAEDDEHTPRAQRHHGCPEPRVSGGQLGTHLPEDGEVRRPGEERQEAAEELDRVRGGARGAEGESGSLAIEARERAREDPGSQADVHQRRDGHRAPRALPGSAARPLGRARGDHQVDGQGCGKHRERLLLREERGQQPDARRHRPALRPRQSPAGERVE